MCFPSFVQSQNHLTITKETLLSKTKFTVHFTKLLTNGFRSSFEIPKFATNLVNSLRSSQSNRELRNEVVNSTPNFVGKLQSSSRAKFAPFGVVGLVK